MNLHPFKNPRVLEVTEEDGHVTITTDPARAGAILFVLAGGTLEEAGRSIGVTRERMRQYLKAAGLTTRDRKRPSANQTENAVRWKRMHDRKLERRAARHVRWRRVIALIQELAAKNDEAPTAQELALALDPSLEGRWASNWATPWLASWLGYNAFRHPRYWRIVGRMYWLAGVRRPRAGWSWRSRRPGWGYGALPTP